jgi:hypothetical protein
LVELEEDHHSAQAQDPGQAVTTDSVRVGGHGHSEEKGGQALGEDAREHQFAVREAGETRHCSAVDYRADGSHSAGDCAIVCRSHGVGTIVDSYFRDCGEIDGR